MEEKKGSPQKWEFSFVRRSQVWYGVTACPTPLPPLYAKVKRRFYKKNKILREEILREVTDFARRRFCKKTISRKDSDSSRKNHYQSWQLMTQIDWMIQICWINQSIWDIIVFEREKYINSMFRRSCSPILFEFVGACKCAQ